MPNYGPGSDHGPVPDGDTAENTDPSANPYISADSHGRCYARLWSAIVP